MAVEAKEMLFSDDSVVLPSAQSAAYGRGVPCSSAVYWPPPRAVFGGPINTAESFTHSRRSRFKPMVCPECGGEFPWYETACPTCGIDLVERLPGPEPTPEAELVSILVTGDAGLIPLAKSLLEAERIEYLVRGENLQDLFGLGRITGYNFAMGPAEFLVRADDAERARAVLDALDQVTTEPESPGDDEPNTT
jgi:Putative prokaryotic signal transducing protein